MTSPDQISRETNGEFWGLIGDANHSEYVDFAAKLLSSGHLVTLFIGGSDGGKVGGILGNPFCPESLEKVIEIKSRGGKQRQRLFPLVANPETVTQLIDMTHLGSHRLEDFIDQGFIQFPAIASIEEIFDPAFYSLDNGIPIIQFFLPQPDTLLETLLRKTGNKEKYGYDVLFGTSANFTGQPSIKNKLRLAFWASTNGMYVMHDEKIVNSPQLGSYNIKRCLNGEITTVR